MYSETQRYRLMEIIYMSKIVFVLTLQGRCWTMKTNYFASQFSGCSKHIYAYEYEVHKFIFASRVGLEMGQLLGADYHLIYLFIRQGLC